MYFAVGLMFSQAETPQPVTNLEIIFTLAVSLISIMLLAYVVGHVRNRRRRRRHRRCNRLLPRSGPSTLPGTRWTTPG